MLILSLLYFGFGFYLFSDKALGRQNIPFSITAGILLSILPIAILFKLLYWGGAEVMLVTGIICAFIVLIITVLSNKTKDNLQTYYNNMLKRTIVLGLAVVVLYITPLSTLLNLQHHDDPELARLKIEAFKNPNNKAAHDSLDAYTMRKYNYSSK